MDSTTNSSPARLPRSVIARYAAGSLGTGGFATLPGLVLVYYMTDSLGIAALVAGGIITLAKVWDVLIDPVIGALSDRALARSGSRRGPMLVGAIGLPVAFALTFAVPPGLSPPLAAGWVLVAFVAAATCFSLFQVPYIALPAELTDGYNERTRLLTWRVVVLTFAILLFGAGGPELRGLFPDNAFAGYLTMGVVAAVVLGVGLSIASTVAPRGGGFGEAVPGATNASRVFTLSHYRDGLAALRESQPFRALLLTFVLQGLATGMMLASAQFVARWILGDEGAVTPLFAALIAPALFVAPLWGKLAERVGKERAFRLASTLFLVAAIVLTAMIWVPGWWILAPVALAGAAYAGMQSLPMAMLPDVIGHDADAREGRDGRSGQAGRAGVFGGVWTAGETAGMALGATILTVMLAASGYIESVAGASVSQPASAVVSIALSFSVVPALLMVVSLAALTRYRLRESDITSAASPTAGELS
ncbi:MFS transporter [Leucobacter salsicius]|uniref:MFS transporter n=1 Tax=Leucobacter salsicius TaxID=664638 RepID=UPI0003486590|nr:MFS transporter [Leucobacter salsicius]